MTELATKPLYHVHENNLIDCPVADYWFASMAMSHALNGYHVQQAVLGSGQVIGYPRSNKAFLVAALQAGESVALIGEGGAPLVYVVRDNPDQQ